MPRPELGDGDELADKIRRLGGNKKAFSIRGIPAIAWSPRASARRWADIAGGETPLHLLLDIDEPDSGFLVHPPELAQYRAKRGGMLPTAVSS